MSGYSGATISKPKMFPNPISHTIDKGGSTNYSLLPSLKLRQAKFTPTFAKAPVGKIHCSLFTKNLHRQEPPIVHLRKRFGSAEFFGAIAF